MSHKVMLSAAKHSERTTLRYNCLRCEAYSSAVSPHKVVKIASSYSSQRPIHQALFWSHTSTFRNIIMSAPTANFTISTTALIVPAVFLSLAICCVGLRVYVRTGLLRSFLIEDWLCVLTLIFFSAHAGLLFGVEASLATPKPSLEVYEKIINVSLATPEIAR